MALQFISRAIFNKYLQQFTSQFYESFPELTHLKSELDDTLIGLLQDNELLKYNEKKRTMLTESIAKGERGPLTATELKEQEDEIVNDEQIKNDLDIIAKIFLNSFKNFGDRLKACDEGLLAEKECVFLHHLQLNRVWWDENNVKGSSKLDDNDKLEVWAYLNGAYLILEIFVVTPPEVIKKIEDMIGDLFHKLVTKKDKFDKPEFMAVAKEVIHDIKTEDITNITDYFWDFITSEFTPIYHLLPESFHSKTRIALKMVQDKDGRDQLMKIITPLVDDVKRRVGSTSMRVDEKEGKIIYEKELMGDSKEAIEGRRKEKERILECIIDAIAEILSKETGLVDTFKENPEEGLKELMKKLGPMVTSFFNGANIKKEEDSKREKEERDGIYLKGAPTIRRANNDTSSTTHTISTPPSSISNSSIRRAY